ncbi:MAG: exopolysaccharide biosynthesis protein [Alphaproteobacteria bacterium]
MREHVPTSVILEELLAAAPEDGVTLAWLVGSLRERAFGFVMLLLALAGIVPGVAMFVGVLLTIPAIQMMLGREHPIFPRFIAAKRMPTPKITRLVRRLIGPMRRAEKLFHPRWPTPFGATKRGVGLIVLLLAVTILGPLPFSHIIPIFAIVLLSFAYLEEDGVLLCIGFAVAIASLAITLATVWGAIAGADWLDPA